MTDSSTENTILHIKFTSYFHFWWNEKNESKSDKKAFLQYFENQHEGKLPNYFFHIFVLFNFLSPILIFDAQIKISYKSYAMDV